MQILPADVMQAQKKQQVVNDFAINIATENGSGSQTANTAILRALFKMGIPVNGKNLFPSNIKGLPTWYIIRASKNGYTARRHQYEILVAMNQKTIEEDLANLASGGVCFYNDSFKFEPDRTDVIYYPMPAKELLKGVDIPANLRNYIINMVYVGALTQVLGIEIDQIEQALFHHFGGRPKPVALNMEVVKRAYYWAKENLLKQDPYAVEPMGKTAGKIMLDGNSAAALGAVYGGVTFAAWYPITPSTSLIDALNEYLPKLRRDAKTGEPTYVVVQAEDELAAAGMVIGAGWAGARAMTATSGPGISLMAEFAGLGYFAEVPAVFWDIVRIGPSTGLPTRTSQGDVAFVYNLGHGDTKQICLFPGSLEECFEFGYKALDLAEQLQTPVFVLSDVDLGMNQWMGEAFAYPAEPLKRGKVLTAEDLDRLGGKFARYRDVDGDGIPYRTLPGNTHHNAAYFARGTGHNEEAAYSERPDDWENNLTRLSRKFETARRYVPAPVANMVKGAKIGLMAYGSTDPAVVEARDRLRAKKIETSYLRLRALPLSDGVAEFIASHDRVYVVENNFNGQMGDILRAELPEMADRLFSLAHCDGLPLTARWIVEAFEKEEQKYHA